MDSQNITPQTKLADLIELNYKLLGVLSRMGISLGFGERTVAEACAAHGIGVSSFLLICSEYTFDNYVPSGDLLASARLVDIVKYLHNSHISYLHDEMDPLEKQLIELISTTDDGQKKVVRKFFMDYKKEVVSHFDYEEDVVFPYIDALLSDRRSSDYSMAVFEENHSNIEDKLCDLKNIVLKYLPTSCDGKLRNSVLFRIFYLEEDLLHHTAVEDHVMVPMVNILIGDGR